MALFQFRFQFKKYAASCTRMLTVEKTGRIPPTKRGCIPRGYTLVYEMKPDAYKILLEMIYLLLFISIDVPVVRVSCLYYITPLVTLMHKADKREPNQGTHANRLLQTPDDQQISKVLTLGP